MARRLICSLLFISIIIMSCFACQKETSSEESEKSSYISESAGQSDTQKEESNPSEGSADKSNFYIMFIDVGQADASLIMCDGHYMLIDGGNVADSNRIYSVLKSRGVKHLDYVIGTHAHEDHIGGITAAFSACTVGKVFSPVTEAENVPFNNFKKAAQRQGLSLDMPKLDTVYTLGNSRFTVLAPRADYVDVNNSSIVLRLEYGDNVFLFTGDAERESEQAMLNAGCNLSADLLKVGHHGSNSSSTYAFLREVMPTYAIISAGADNDYGHPHKEVLDRLNDADAKVLRTDKSGGIVCYSDGQELRFEYGVDDGNVSYKYIGNKNNGTLHTTQCGGLPKEENREYFVDLEDAERVGYTKRCSNCMGN